MQDSESIAKAIKAIEAQVKAIAEELQVDGSAALQILEDACGGADAVVRWALSASEEQGTGHKCQDSGDAVKCSLFKDGTIAFTIDDEADLD